LTGKKEQLVLLSFLQSLFEGRSSGTSVNLKLGKKERRKYVYSSLHLS